jgi:uncharacterized membrane protein HdeD (DUF308 family)
MKDRCLHPVHAACRKLAKVLHNNIAETVLANQINHRLYSGNHERLRNKGESVMLKSYGKFWWSFFLRGIIAVLFGLTAILMPGITLEILALLLAAFLIADGIISLVVSFRSRTEDVQWWLLLLEGLAGIIIGILAFARPGLTILAVILIVGFWAILTGMLEIAAAVKLRHEIKGEGLLGLGGIISILFGIILLVNPGAGAVVMTLLIGGYALIFGIFLILLGLKLRKHNVTITIAT